jgi:hypothetical protein
LRQENEVEQLKIGSIEINWKIETITPERHYTGITKRRDGSGGQALSPPFISDLESR